MSTPDNNPTPTVTSEPQLSSVEGGVNVGSPDTLSLAELNGFLGTNYKDKPTALAALKETKNYVGKKIDAANPAPVVQAQADPALVAQVQSLTHQVFYAQYPQYKGYESIINAMGSNPADVVNTEPFKLVFEKGKVADEVGQRRSIVGSNPRLAATKSAVDEAVVVANASRSTGQTADVLARAIRAELEG